MTLGRRKGTKFCWLPTWTREDYLVWLEWVHCHWVDVGEFGYWEYSRGR